jgi:hypothetical protein
MGTVRALAGGVFYLLALAGSSHAQIDVITNRYDSARTGSNLQETVLNVSNVNSSQFEFLYSYPVDGSIYAQPLYVARLRLPDLTVHNVVYVATMNDKLYAFDADTNGRRYGRGTLRIRPAASRRFRSRISSAATL